MSAIYRRELGSYFTSPIGYAVLAAFMFFSGIFFYSQCLFHTAVSGPTAFNYTFFCDENMFV